MRVLHLQRVYGVAGSEKYLLRLLPELARRGVDVRFLTLEPPGGDQLNAAFYATLDRTAVPNSRVAFGTWPTPTSLWKAAQIVRRFRPDIVHSHLIHGDLFAACLKRTFATGPLFVSTKHGYRERFQATHGLDGQKIRLDPASMVVRFSSNAMSGSFAVSRGLRQLYVDGALVEPGRISVIPHGMEATPPKPRDPSLRVGDPQIVVVGRLVEFKGHRYALEAVARIAARHSALKLVVVGEGPLKDELVARAAALGITRNVLFMGFSDRVTDHIRAADVMLVPSTSEGFGLVFLEAFDAGTPVVAFDVAAGNEIIEHDRSGLLVPFGDVTALGGAIDRLVASPADRERLAAGARQRLRSEFTLEGMVAKTVEFYESVLQRRRRR